MPSGIYQHKRQSPELIKKRVESRKGYKHSKKTIEKIRKSNLGQKRSDETKRKLRLTHLGKKHTEEWKKNQSIKMKGIKKLPRTKEHSKKISETMRKQYENGRVSPFRKIWQENPDFLRGENNPNWIENRTEIKGYWTERSNPEYKQWVNKIKKRDNRNCKINNKDCSGYCVVHHILSWSEYPELRYNINNGITLCQAHHPRKRAEEKRLIPFFQGLVPVSN